MTPLHQIPSYKWWCALFIAAWLLCLPIRSWCSQGQPMAGQADNAAFYYQKAIDLANIPPWDQLEIIRDIIENGWQEDHQDLIEILQDNQAAFAELKKGLAQPRCDFSDGKEKEYEYLYEKPIPNYIPYRNLAWLVLFEGRLLQKKGRHSQALDRYLATLTFATHLSQGGDFIGYLISTTLIARAGKPIERYLNRVDLAPKFYQRIFEALKNTQTQKSSFAQAMRSEKLSMMSAVEHMCKILEDKGVNKLKKRDPNLSDEQARQILGRRFPVKIIQDEYNKLFNEYFGYLIKAAGSCDPQDWEMAHQKILALQKETGVDKFDESKFHQTLWTLKVAASSVMIAFPHPAVKRYFCKKFAKYLFSFGIPTYYSNNGTKMCRKEAQFNALLQAAAAKIQ